LEKQERDFLGLEEELVLKERQLAKLKDNVGEGRR